MLVLDIFLIPLYGINGASIGSTLSYLTATVVVVVMYTKHNNVSVKSVLIPTKLDIETFRNAYKQLWR
jgi:Na+-driven multidrug efflux pump